MTKISTSERDLLIAAQPTRLLTVRHPNENALCHVGYIGEHDTHLCSIPASYLVEREDYRSGITFKDEEFVPAVVQTTICEGHAQVVQREAGLHLLRPLRVAGQMWGSYYPKVGNAPGTFDVYLEADTGSLTKSTVWGAWSFTAACAPMWVLAGADLTEFNGLMAQRCIRKLHMALDAMEREPELFRRLEDFVGAFDLLTVALRELASGFARYPMALVHVGGHGPREALTSRAN